MARLARKNHWVVHQYDVLSGILTEAGCTVVIGAVAVLFAALALRWF